MSEPKKVIYVHADDLQPQPCVPLDPKTGKEVELSNPLHPGHAEWAKTHKPKTEHPEHFKGGQGEHNDLKAGQSDCLK